MQSQEEQDFLIVDAEKIVVGKPYHWRDWSIVLDKDLLFLWNDAVVLALPKFSGGWFYFTLDEKLAAMNPEGIPVQPIHIHLSEILQKLQEIHHRQIKTGSPSEPILSAPAATCFVVGEWSLFCIKETEISIQNSNNDTVEIMLKEDLPGFKFQTKQGEIKPFIAKHPLGPEFAAGWAGKKEKRPISNSKLDLKQKEEKDEEILIGKPYHWHDWSIVVDKDVLYLWNDAVVLGLAKSSYGWFYFILDGKLAAMNPDGIPVNPIHIHVSEILEKLQEIHQSQMETGLPSQPILSAPGATRFKVGEWSLFCKKEDEISAQNTITCKQETITLKEDLPGFIFKTDIGGKKLFIAENTLSPEFNAGWAVKKEKRLIAKQKEEELLIEDAEVLVFGKPYHWRDWNIVLDKGYLYLWSDTAVIQLPDGSAGWFRFILDGKITEMFPGAKLKNETDECRREILKHLQVVHRNQMETGSPSQSILSAPGTTRLVFGTWSLFCNRRGEINVHHSIFSKQRITLREDLPGFIFEPNIGDKRLFTAENSLGSEFPEGWAKKKEKRFSPKPKLKDLARKEEDLLSEDAEEILPGKPYHWHNWNIVLDDIYLYLWSDATVLDLCKESGGWFRFILDGEIAVMHSRGITVNVPEEYRRETLEKLQALHRNQVKKGPPSQPILTAPGATRFVVGNWFLFCNTDGEISVRHSIYCKHAITLKEDMPGFIFESSIGKIFEFRAKISLDNEFTAGWAGKNEKHFNAKSKSEDLKSKSEDLKSKSEDLKSKSEDLKQKDEDLLLEDAKEIVLGKPYHWRDWSIVLDKDCFFLWSDVVILQLSIGNIGWFRFILDGEIAIMYPDGNPGSELNECRREIQEKLHAVRQSQMETGPPSQPILSVPGSTPLVVGPWSLLCKRDGEIRVHNSFISQEAIVLKEDLSGFMFETESGEKKIFTAKKTLDPEFVAGWAKKKVKCFNSKPKLKDSKQKIK